MKVMKSEDYYQKEELFNDLYDTFNRESFWRATKKVQGQVGYLKGNKIASYSLYNSEYHITDKMEELLISRGFDLTKTHKRSSIHNVRLHGNGSSTKYGPKLGTYEHSIPAGVQFSMIKEICKTKGKITREELRNILDTCGVVVNMTQEENKLLEGNGLRDAMPNGCNPMENPFGRYEEVGIKLSGTMVSVDGRVMR